MPCFTENVFLKDEQSIEMRIVTQTKKDSGVVFFDLISVFFLDMEVELCFAFFVLYQSD